MSNNELERPAAAEAGNQWKERIDVDPPNNENEKNPNGGGGSCSPS